MTREVLLAVFWQSFVKIMRESAMNYRVSTLEQTAFAVYTDFPILIVFPIMSTSIYPFYGSWHQTLFLPFLAGKYRSKYSVRVSPFSLSGCELLGGDRYVLGTPLMIMLKIQYVLKVH